jgi:hypothetical protein
VATTISIYSVSGGTPQPLSRLDFQPGEQIDAQAVQDSRLFFISQAAQNNWAEFLGVVDFSDPGTPLVTSKALLPSIRTRLFPIQGQVVTLGDGTNGTPMLLFDIQDRQGPKLMDQMVIGSTVPTGFTGTSLDTVQYVPEFGAVLVPEPQIRTNSLVRTVRIVEVADGQLRQRGLINEDVVVNRAFGSGGRIWLLGDHKLVGLDSTALDQPKTVSVIELDWPVDFVVLQDDLLVQISASYDPNGINGPRIRVSDPGSPDRLLSEFALQNRPVVGVTKRADRLFVLQGWNGGSEEPSRLLLSVFSMATLPDLELLGSAEGPVPPWTYRPYFAVWPKSDLLVWVPGFPYA